MRLSRLFAIFIRGLCFLKIIYTSKISWNSRIAFAYLTGEVPAINLDQRNTDAQEFIAITGADFREGHGEAYYAAGADFIVSFLGSKPSSSDEERLEPFFSHRLTP